eukprot:6083811-Pleurochrysis_carterae.AAC.1
MPIHTAAAAVCHLCGLAASSCIPRAGRGGTSAGSGGRASASRSCRTRCSTVAARMTPWQVACIGSAASAAREPSRRARAQSHESVTSRPSSTDSTMSRSARSRASRPPGAKAGTKRTPKLRATSSSQSPTMHAQACA